MKYQLFLILLISVFLTNQTKIYAQTKKESFILVIDPGHGGHDPGCIGKKKVKEKDVNLGVAKKLGSLVSKNCPDVKVIYTRSTDVFIELKKRAEIANRNKADLFISIHANSVDDNKGPHGVETYTLGLSRSKENLRVAMRENSVILMEDDYQTHYEGFDPNSTESYIMFDLMHNKHMEQSINFASMVQNNFRAINRYNRGVKQDIFMVLKKTSMPSVLIELGFLSNPNEEQFLHSQKGQQKMANSIYKAFLKYKAKYAKNTTLNAKENRVNSDEDEDTEQEPIQTAVDTKKGVTIYKVQILVATKKLPDNAWDFKGYKPVSYYKEGKYYKYTYGESTDFNEIKRIRKSLLKDFKGAFIVEFKDGKKIK